MCDMPRAEWTWSLCSDVSQDFPDVARDVIVASPKYLWLQLGIRNGEAVMDVESRGALVYQDICIEETHQRLLQANLVK